MSIRKQYDDALADLQQALAEMGQACADAVDRAPLHGAAAAPAAGGR